VPSTSSTVHRWIHPSPKSNSYSTAGLAVMLVVCAHGLGTFPATGAADDGRTAVDLDPDRDAGARARGDRVDPRALPPRWRPPIEQVSPAHVREIEPVVVPVPETLPVEAPAEEPVEVPAST